MTTNTFNNHLITVEELSERLMCSLNIAYRLVRSKEIPSFKVTGHWRITEADYDEYIKNQKLSNDYDE